MSSHLVAVYFLLLAGSLARAQEPQKLSKLEQLVSSHPIYESLAPGQEHTLILDQDSDDLLFDDDARVATRTVRRTLPDGRVVEYEIVDEIIDDEQPTVAETSVHQTAPVADQSGKTPPDQAASVLSNLNVLNAPSSSESEAGQQPQPAPRTVLNKRKRRPGNESPTPRPDVGVAQTSLPDLQPVQASSDQSNSENEPPVDCLKANESPAKTATALENEPTSSDTAAATPDESNKSPSANKRKTRKNKKLRNKAKRQAGSAKTAPPATVAPETGKTGEDAETADENVPLKNADSPKQPQQPDDDNSSNEPSNTVAETQPSSQAESADDDDLSDAVDELQKPDPSTDSRPEVSKDAQPSAVVVEPTAPQQQQPDKTPVNVNQSQNLSVLAPPGAPAAPTVAANNGLAPNELQKVEPAVADATQIGQLANQPATTDPLNQQPQQKGPAVDIEPVAPSDQAPATVQPAQNTIQLQPGQQNIQVQPAPANQNILVQPPADQQTVVQPAGSTTTIVQPPAAQNTVIQADQAVAPQQVILQPQQATTTTVVDPNAAQTTIVEKTTVEDDDDDYTDLDDNFQQQGGRGRWRRRWFRRSSRKGGRRGGGGWGRK